MLVLSRKLSERILIGPDIAITIVKIEGNQVRVGIEAPPDVTILRSELADRSNSSPVANPAPARHRRSKLVTA
jgi:carbon storage regulator